MAHTEDMLGRYATMAAVLLHWGESVPATWIPIKQNCLDLSDI